MQKDRPACLVDVEQMVGVVDLRHEREPALHERLRVRVPSFVLGHRPLHLKRERTQHEVARRLRELARELGLSGAAGRFDVDASDQRPGAGVAVGRGELERTIRPAVDHLRDGLHSPHARAIRGLERKR